MAYELYNYRNAITLSAADHLFVKTGYEHIKLLFDDIFVPGGDGKLCQFRFEK